MVTTAERKTIEDLHAMPDDGRRYELIDGEIVVSASPSELHFWVSRRLIRLLLPFDEVHQLGWLYWAPLELWLPHGDVVQPDLFFFGRERPPSRPGSHLEGVPTLVAEVSSPSTRDVDRGRKFSAYQRAGVSEYWMADPDRREVRAYILRNGKFERLPQDGPVIRSEVLAGFEVNVESLFADLR
jgi:Uma2 family endonuclease